MSASDAFVAACDRRSVKWWLLLLLASAVPLLAALGLGLWRTPYAISETIAVLEDLHIKPPSAFLLPEPAYYRPVFWLTLWAVRYSVVAVSTAMTLFKWLHIATVLPLIVLFIWHLRPRTVLDAAAGTMAVAVLVSAPGFRDNLENLPLNQMMVIMLVALIVWILLEREARAWHGPVIVGLTIIAIGFKEQGLLVAALVAGACLMGAPGAGRRTALTVCGVAAVYLLMRLGIGVQSWPPVQDIGLGFHMMSATEAVTRFSSANRVLLYAYSAASTAGNILFSEPTGGVFRIVQALATGNGGFSQVNHLLSSAAMTTLVCVQGVRSLKQDRGSRRPWSIESRAFMAFVLMLAGSAALGFAFTRDRFGGVAVVFYALTAFFAVRAAAASLAGLARPALVIGAGAMLVLAAAWQIRAVGTIQYVRDTAMTNRKEWLVDLPERRENFARRQAYLQILDELTPQGIDPTGLPKGPDPRWFAALFGQR